MFYSDFKNFNSLNPRKGRTKEKKEAVQNNVSELYNGYLGAYFNQYMALSDAKKRNLGDPVNLFLVNSYNYNNWFKKEESVDTTRKSDKEESDIPPLEGDEEEVKEGQGLTILTPNKLLTRLPILLAQIKAGNNSCKLKNEIKQVLFLLNQHNKITKKVYNNLIKSS